MRKKTITGYACRSKDFQFFISTVLPKYVSQHSCWIGGPKNPFIHTLGDLLRNYVGTKDFKKITITIENLSKEERKHFKEQDSDYGK